MRGRRKARRILFVVAVGVIFSVFVTGYLLEVYLTPALLATAEYKTRIQATEAIYRAIKNEIVAGISYQDLVHIEKDNRGGVAYMEANYAEVDRLVSRAALAIQDELKRLEGQVIRIPLGLALGSKFFAAYGPQLSTTIIPIGVANLELKDWFTDAGINQTKHTIELVAEVDMKVIIPLVTSSFKVTTRVPLTSLVIVGDVPWFYLNGLRKGVGGLEGLFGS